MKNLLESIDFGKIPPQSIDIEEAVLGALMIDKDAIFKIINIVTSDSFYKESHKIIFNSILNLHNKNIAIDILTVVEQLKKDNKLKSVGGPYSITLLTEKISSSANIEYHARIITEKYLQRKLIDISNLIQKKCYEETDVNNLINFTFNKIFEINKIFIGESNLIKIDKIVLNAKKALDIRIKKANNNELIGIPTGLSKLDYITTGWLPANLIILAGRPSMGKTALAIKFAREAAFNNKPVCIYSLEMSAIKLIDRMIISISGVNANSYSSGKNININSLNAIDDAILKLKNLPIYIDDKASVSIDYISNHSRIMHEEGKCEFIIIDYLQLASTENYKKGQNRERDVAEMSREVKKLSKDLNIPIIMLAQLNRKVEDKVNKIPTLSSLRESGAIEQDADIVLFIHRPSVFGYVTMLEDGVEVSTKNRGHLIIAKHREGGLGTIPFYHSDNMTIIEDADKGFNNIISDPDKNIKPIYDNDDDLPF